MIISPPTRQNWVITGQAMRYHHLLYIVLGALAWGCAWRADAKKKAAFLELFPNLKNSSMILTRQCKISIANS